MNYLSNKITFESKKKQVQHKKCINNSINFGLDLLKSFKITKKKQLSLKNR